LDDRLELSEDDDAVIALLEARTNDLELDLFALLGSLKVRAANVEIARKQDLERSHLGVDADLALEGHRHTERLSRVRHTDIRLKLHGVVQSSLDKVGASQRIVYHGNAALVNVALGDADAFIPMTKLGKKTCLDIALKVFRVNVNIPDESTTFEERITHTVCSY
jgi:DNA-binding phage protein